MVTKKSQAAQKVILKHSKDFNGSLTDVEVIQVPVNRPRIGNVALRRDHIAGSVR
ncbi:hypothetical protein SAMN05216343_10473 [Oscillibacter sp. PC13]|nr:hypothetical protein SAMN05216343_10473 [Oscillibacter sp. PC13]